MTDALTTLFFLGVSGTALGLLLMGMSLIFILIIHLIGRKGAKARG